MEDELRAGKVTRKDVQALIENVRALEMQRQYVDMTAVAEGKQSDVVRDVALHWTMRLLQEIVIMLIGRMGSIRASCLL